MKVNVELILTGLDGQPVLDVDDNEAPISLRKVCINALMATLEEDRNRSGEDKLTAWTLAKRIQDQAEVEMTPEEVSLVKDRIGRCFGPLLVGPAFQSLNG